MEKSLTPNKDEEKDDIYSYESLEERCIPGEISEDHYENLILLNWPQPNCTKNFGRAD